MEEEMSPSEVINEENNSNLPTEINNLGELIGLNRDSDTEKDVDYLQRISRSVRLLLSPGSLESLDSKTTGGISLATFPLGFDTKDVVVNQVALVLKMLYLADFRELQNDLNALIVLGQEYTANPRTNTLLGKVGR
jgi:hypothetical protein